MKLVKKLVLSFVTIVSGFLLSLGITACSLFPRETVTKLEILNGDVEISNIKAKEGEKVFLVHEADDGYEFVSYIVKTESGEIITVTNNIFTMPDENVKVGANFKLIDYTLNANSTSGGTVSVKSTANFDEVVTITTTPETGYALKSLEVRDASNNLVNVNGNTFVMPKSNVTINAVYDESYEVLVEPYQNGTVTITREDTFAGTLVTVEVEANLSYVVSSFSIVDGNNQPITLTNNTFTMPNNNVTVTAVFEKEFLYTNNLVFTYRKEGSLEYYEVTGTTTYAGNTGIDLIIPEKYLGDEGYFPVVKIADEALINGRFTNVYIPKTVTSIGSRVFRDCRYLKNVIFAEDSQLTSLSFSIFSGCEVFENINLENCEKLTTITSFGASYGKLIKTLNIPKSVSSFFFDSDLVLENDYALENYIVDENNQNYCSVDGVLYSKDKTVLYHYPKNKAATSFEIANTVERINQNAFYCSTLSSITFEENSSLKQIDYRAFGNCKNLTAISLPASLEKILSDAFDECTDLATITFEGSSVTQIDRQAFGSTKISSIIIPKSVTTLGENVFEGCYSLTSVKFEENSVIQTLDKILFMDCTKLTSLELPKSLTNIDFSRLTTRYIKNIQLEDGNTVYKTVNDMIMDKDETTVYFCNRDKTGSITLPSTITTISKDAFMYCKISSITLPENLVTIDDYAFAYCESLSSITIPNKVNYIGRSAFQNSGLSTVTFKEGGSDNLSLYSSAFAYTNIQSIVFPERAAYLGAKLLYECSKLTSVTILNYQEDWAQQLYDSSYGYYYQKVDLSGNCVNKFNTSSGNVSLTNRSR